MNLVEFLTSTPGEVEDMAACYQIMQGLADEKPEEKYIPELR